MWLFWGAGEVDFSHVPQKLTQDGGMLKNPLRNGEYPQIPLGMAGTPKPPQIRGIL